MDLCLAVLPQVSLRSSYSETQSTPFTSARDFPSYCYVVLMISVRTPLCLVYLTMPVVATSSHPSLRFEDTVDSTEAQMCRFEAGGSEISAWANPCGHTAAATPFAFSDEWRQRAYQPGSISLFSKGTGFTALKYHLSSLCLGIFASLSLFIYKNNPPPFLSLS